MDLEDALDLIDYAFGQKDEELLFLRWVHGWQFTISFGDFKKQLIQSASIDSRTEKEILHDVKDILSLNL